MTDKPTELYIDIKQAAQILNNVSIRTAYKYIEKSAEGISVDTYNEVTGSGGVKKLYRKSDIIALAIALNKDRTVLVQVPVNVRSAAPKTTEEMAITERSSNALEPITKKMVVRLAVGTLGLGLLILASGLIIAGILIDKGFYRESRQIASLKSFIAHKKI